MSQCKFSISVKVLDGWIGMNKKWNYIAYLLCNIAGKVYLLEREI